MENQKKQPLNKKLLAGAVALIAAVAVLAAVYFGTRPAASAGEKDHHRDGGGPRRGGSVHDRDR